MSESEVYDGKLSLTGSFFFGKRRFAVLRAEFFFLEGTGRRPENGVRLRAILIVDNDGTGVV